MSDAPTAANRLISARRTHHREPAPAVPDAAAAYAVQDTVARALGWFGDGPARHWKSGGPSRSEPLLHAPLPPDGVWASPADARAWPFSLRGIEAEIALRLREPVDRARAEALDLPTASALVDAMCVSIEVVDSRWTEGLDAPAWARLADLSCHGALVLGAWVDVDRTRDWSRQACRVRIGGQPLQTFCGSHALADPTFVLPAWLRHATRDGAVLAAGSVVTTGTWCGLLHAQPGDEVEVAFDGIGVASVRL